MCLTVISLRYLINWEERYLLNLHKCSGLDCLSINLMLKILSHFIFFHNPYLYIIFSMSFNQAYSLPTYDASYIELLSNANK